MFPPVLPLLQRPITLFGHERAITCVKYNLEGDLFFSASQDGRVFVWRAETGERIGSYYDDKADSRESGKDTKDTHLSVAWEIDVTSCVRVSVACVCGARTFTPVFSLAGMLVGIIFSKFHVFVS